MKKYLSLLLLAAAFLGACQDDLYVGSISPDEKPIANVENIDPTFVRLVDDSTNVAGILEFTASGESATIQWNVSSKSNLDTTQGYCSLG